MIAEARRGKRYNAQVPTLPRLVVVWRVTERCNLGCRFCAYDVHLTRARGEADPAEVSRLGRLLAQHGKATGREILVSWLGGEPMLWPHLREVSAELGALGVRMAVTTNGLALGQESWQRWALERLDEVTLSLDGLAAFHDWGRRRQGSHALALEALRGLAQRKRSTGRGPLLRVNAVLMRDNVAQLEALCALVAEAGAEELTFNQLGGRDRPEFFPAHRLLIEQVEALAESLPGLQSKLAERGLAVRGSLGYLQRLRFSASGIPLPVDDCGPGQHFWFVECDGRISPCHFTTAGYGIPSAELRTAKDLDALPIRFAMLRRARRLAPCLDCHSTQVFEKFRPPAAG